MPRAVMDTAECRDAVMKSKWLILLAAGPILAVAVSRATALDEGAKGASAASWAPVVERIDRALDAEWAARGLADTASADDATWLRRLSIDLLSTIPEAGEVAAFLVDPSADKRDRKVDQYLDDRRFSETLARLWTQLLLGASGVNEAKLTGYLQRWLESAFSKGMAFDRIVRELNCATGEGAEPGPMSFQLAYYDTIETLAGVTARAFLGLQIQCAQCHDHPFDHWKRSEFNRFTGFLADMQGDLRVGVGQRVPHWRLLDRTPEWGVYGKLNRVLRKLRGAADDGAMDDGAMAGASMAGGAMGGEAQGSNAGDGLSALQELFARFRRSGDESSGASMTAPSDAVLDEFAPRLPADAREAVALFRERRELFGDAGFLDARPYEPLSDQSKRQALAAWITSPENPWFAQAIVNRAWGHLFGKGLIEPIDDLSGSKDRLLPELLADIGRDFLRNGTDLRGLIGALVRTKAYGLRNSTAADPERRAEQERCFAAHPLRAFTPEQLQYSITQATTGVVLESRNGAWNREQSKFLDELRSRVTAIDGNGERRLGASIPQALFMMNGRYSYRSATLKKEGRLERFLDVKLTPEERLRDLWYATLGRPPAPAEAAAIVRAVDARDDEGFHAFEDLFWALLNSAEFQCNH